MDRVCVWTSGQPHLTKKVARGVHIRAASSKTSSVWCASSCCCRQPGATNRSSSGARGADESGAGGAWGVEVLGRIARRARPAAPAAPAVRAALELSGVVARDTGGMMRDRNRVVREAFGTRWVKSVAPVGWRTWAEAAALAVLAALGG